MIRRFLIIVILIVIAFFIYRWINPTGAQDILNKTKNLIGIEVSTGDTNTGEVLSIELSGQTNTGEMYSGTMNSGNIEIISDDLFSGTDNSQSGSLTNILTGNDAVLEDILSQPDTSTETNISNTNTTKTTPTSTTPKKSNEDVLQELFQ